MYCPAARPDPTRHSGHSTHARHTASPIQRDARRPDPEDVELGTRSRLRDFQMDPRILRGRPAHRRRRALSRAAQARGTRLDRVELEDDGIRPRSACVSPYGRRPTRDAHRSRCLASLRRRFRPRTHHSSNRGSHMSNRDDADLPLSRQKPVADDVRGELEFHIEQRTQELIAKGHLPDEARRLAQEAFGDRHRVEAECREIEIRRRVARRRARRMEELRQDLKIGARLLGRSPGYTLAAILTLALGIGANTAVFSIVNDVLLTPLATEDADRLVSVVERHEQGWGNLPSSTFTEMQQQSRSFTSITQHATQSTTVLGADQPLKATVAWVTSGFFQVFPVRVERGRLPLPEEHRLGASPVAIVSHSFWRDRLGSPGSLAGIRLRVSFDHEVIGVLPPGYEFPGEADIWVPGELIEQSTSHTSHGWTTIGRLRPGIDAAAAQRELDGILAAMKERYYPDFDAIGSTVAPLQDVLTRTAKTPLYLLLGASGILLLAACTNLVSAGLARATI